MRSNVQTNSESGNATSCTAAQSLSPASAVQEVMSKPPAYQDMISAPTPNSTSISTRSAAPQKGSFVFQTETSELCTTHRVSGTDEDLVQLCSSSSLHHHKASQEGMGLVGEKEEQCLQQSCPDILLMDGSSSSGGPENFLDLEDCDSVVAKTLTERPGNAESDMDYRLVVQSHKADGPQLARNDGELSGNSSKSVHFKILHMPFDMQYLEELRKIEASVWSVESLAPRNKTDNTPTSPETSQKRGAVSDLDHQDTSFGALPTYRPSTSWLADFGNVYYYSKLPPNVEEQRKILRCSPLKLSSPKGKPNHDQEPKDPHRVAVTTTAPLRLKGCRLREKVDRRSYSDQECCANRTFNGNTGTSGGLKRERICARCLTTKCSVNKIPGSPGPGLDALIVKRQGVPVPPWEESILAQTCAACKCLPRRRVTRKGSGSDVPGGPHNEETEGETSENREKNCSCEEPHHGPPAAVREGPRRHHHGNVIRERNEENLGVCVSVPLQDKWRNQNQCYLAAQKWQQEKLWRAALSNPDNTESNSSKNGPRHLIKQKKHISQSQ
ncbi:unnamed protein product, partial [Coregonus sp. 'balchen']